MSITTIKFEAYFNCETGGMSTTEVMKLVRAHHEWLGEDEPENVYSKIMSGDFAESGFGLQLQWVYGADEGDPVLGAKGAKAHVRKSMMGVAKRRAKAGFMCDFEFTVGLAGNVGWADEVEIKDFDEIARKAYAKIEAASSKRLTAHYEKRRLEREALEAEAAMEAETDMTVDPQSE